ncbi:hypothetical protein [Rhizobium sp.]|uniref:hypothetical protein n=1 Tax=Rhizobium sp. TaxID=391 RepID=UPI0028B10E78
MSNATIPELAAGTAPPIGGLGQTGMYPVSRIVSRNAEDSRIKIDSVLYYRVTAADFADLDDCLTVYRGATLKSDREL